MKLLTKSTKNPIFADFLNQWVEEELLTSSRSSNTLTTYRVIVRHIQAESISRMRLRSITTSHLQNFMDEICLKKSYARSTCNCYLSVLNCVFRFAIYPKQIILSNPMEFVINKKKNYNISISQNDHLFYNTITPQQFQAITNYLRGHRSSSLLPIQIGYYTGLRLGEVCGLTWEDIDLENEYLIVRRTIFYNTNRHCMEMGTTKSGKPRIVDFGHVLCSILKREKASQEKLDRDSSSNLFDNYFRKVSENHRDYYELYCFQKGEVVPDYMHQINFVCRQGNGSFLKPRTVQNMCISVRRSLPGIDHFHFHSLRHTYTSNLLNKGAVPQDVQELLGHSDVRTTMNIYAHSQRESRRRVVQMLDEV